MRNLLLALLVLLPALTRGAVLNNGILAASDTTGTNATVRSVTITGSTNLWAGTLNATNDITLDGVSLTNRLNLWTNNAGTLHNTVATNLTFQSGSTNVLEVSNVGQIYSGAGARAFRTPADYDRIVGYSESGPVDLYLQSGTNSNPHAYYDVYLDPSSASFWDFGGDAMGGIAGSIYSQIGPAARESFTWWQDGSSVVEIGFNATDGATINVVNRFKALPQIADGSTPYLEDTSVAHSSGYLHETRNNGTNKFSVDWQGAITLAATTNQVIFGGTNTAPSGSITTPAKWISVQVQGEATVYRIPLYQ